MVESCRPKVNSYYQWRITGQLFYNRDDVINSFVLLSGVAPAVPILRIYGGSRINLGSPFITVAVRRGNSSAPYR